ncbi:hypothetical protein Tco_1336254 [Tanacetum coccineum]
MSSNHYSNQIQAELELCSKENKIDIRKCNGRIPRGLTPREPTFQVVLDAIALTPCYLVFLITADVPEVCINSETFVALINSRSLSGKTSGLDKLRLSRAQILWGMFHQKNVDYVELLWEDFIYQIENRVQKARKDFLPSVSHQKSSQIFGAILPECLTSPTMKESKAYKTYIGYATDEEPIRKGKRVKRSVKKSSTKPAIGIVIREPSVETKSKGKEKEMVDVARVKGIELLSEVALTEKAQLKEVRKKSLRDFHKTYPSGSGTGAKKPPSVENITPTVTSEETSDKLGVPDVIEDDSTKSESESWGNDEDDSNNEQEANDEGSRQENESEEQESDSEQDEESDDDNQEEEEVDQENESEDDEIKTGKEVVQGEGADVEMNEAQQGNENLVTTQEQFELDNSSKRQKTKPKYKLSIVREKTEQNQAKSKNVKVRVNTDESAVKPEPELKNTNWMQSQPI